MADCVTANLPSRDFDRTAAFYQTLGFEVRFKGEDWMILTRGSLVIELFPLRHNPRKSCFRACVRVDDLDALYAAWCHAGIPNDCRRIPRMGSPETLPFGMRMFTLIDPDGSLLRCIDNTTTGAA